MSARIACLGSQSSVRRRIAWNCPASLKSWKKASEWSDASKMQLRDPPVNEEASRRSSTCSAAVVSESSAFTSCKFSDRVLLDESFHAASGKDSC